MSMVGEGHSEVEDQAGKFVIIYNDKIYAMNQDQLYTNIFQIGIKENKYTVKNGLPLISISKTG